MTEPSKLTKKDIRALPEKKFVALADSAAKALLQAFGKPADEYPAATAKRYLWILEERNRRRRQALRKIGRELKEAKALPSKKQREAAVRKLLSEIGQ